MDNTLRLDHEPFVVADKCASSLPCYFLQSATQYVKVEQLDGYLDVGLTWE